jgi:MFS family permease
VSSIALFFTLLFMGGTPSIPAVFCLFILQQILINTIFVSISIALGEVTRRSESGSVRGVYLTILSTGVLVAAFFSGIIFSVGSYAGVYLMSALLLVPVIYLTHRFFHSIEEPHYKNISFRESLASISKRKDIKRIMYIQFVLETFFAVMVVYMTPYLAESSGIERSDVLSFIMPIALLPFVIFPYELGILADKKYGEKEILISGLVIALFFTMLIPFVVSSSLVVWALILLGTRIGASFIEEMSSTYFYKKVHPDEAGVITLFNVGTRSAALIIVPLIAFVLFSVVGLPPSYIFFVSGIFLITGIVAVRKLHDTR